MNVSNEQQATEETTVRTLRAIRARDAATAPARHSQQTDQCPNVARFAAVLRFKTSKWTPEENAHVDSCPFCQRVRNMFSFAMKEAAQEETVIDLSTNSEETVSGLKPRKPPKSDPPGEMPKPG
jgi:hypothetical protein